MSERRVILNGPVDAVLVSEMMKALRSHGNRFDGSVPWQRLMIACELGEKWDESQIHFGYLPIEAKYRI